MEHTSHHSHDSHVQSMAFAATLHCLTGCAIGEIAGLLIGTAFGLGTISTLILAVVLAFVFGFALSALPLIKSGLSFGAAMAVVIPADSLSIATMELVDNAVMAVIPGAMTAGIVNPVFWIAMSVALFCAFLAAYPVNIALLKRNKGHALTMKHLSNEHHH